MKVEVAVLGWKESQTLQILCYRKDPDKHGDILLGSGALEVRSIKHMTARPQDARD